LWAEIERRGIADSKIESQIWFTSILNPVEQKLEERAEGEFSGAEVLSADTDS
jgi:hypothetical protein